MPSFTPSSMSETGLPSHEEKFLMVEGTPQNQDDVISVKATAVRVLDLGSAIDVRSHDFH